MPQQNRFRHQVYRSEVPTSPYHLLQPPLQPAVTSEAFRERMQCVGRTLRAAGVRSIYLAHGTFAGTDAFGLIHTARWLPPRIRRALRRRRKEFADTLIGETGNYTPEFAAFFEESLGKAAGGAASIPVRLFDWSSENHHIGRAHGAVRLIDELNRVAEAGTPPGRVLLWGHSHGGNLFALMTNLLAADDQTRERFFSAARAYYRTPLLGRVDMPVWCRVRELLSGRDRPIDRLQLDIVTFGTPIRYGWDTGGCEKLLHFVNHRPAPDLPDYRVPLPLAPQDVLGATRGDVFQQLGIAGTNVAPLIFTVRSWLADRRIGRLIQPGVHRRDLWEHVALGMRVPEDGITLLVDYQENGGELARKLGGHGVYTRREWLAFHAMEVCRRFYA